jgi:hypothetical protein
MECDQTPKLVLTMHEREWRDPVSGLWAQWMESGQELVFFLSIYNKLFLALPQGLLSNEQRLIKGKVFEDKYFFTVY